MFGSREGAFSGWSKAKAALDARMAAALGRRPLAVARFRRTVATRLADLGVQPHVVEAVLNHISGHKAGVAGVYNRASYAHEKRHALDLWGEHVESFAKEGSRTSFRCEARDEGARTARNRLREMAEQKSISGPSPRHLRLQRR